MTALTTEPETITHAAPPRSVWGIAWRRLRRNRLAMVMLAVVAFYAAVALAVTLGWAAADWKQIVGGRNLPPSWDHWGGTNNRGQSIARHAIYGTKVSLTVASFASVLAIGIGVPLGAIAGYFRGWVDELIVWLYSTLSSIPGLLLILAFAFVLRDATLLGYELKGMPAVYIALGLTSWVGLCRLIRGEVIKHKDRDYVTAARAYGASRTTIIFRHVLPNVTHLVIIEFSLMFVAFIHAEVILTFLGLGATNEPSWGGMIDAARKELINGYWWQLTAATVAVFGISLSLNTVGDALRDALDPRIKD